MLPKLLTTNEQIDAALMTNLAALKESFYDLLAALLLFLVAVFSCLHSVLRIVFAFTGLLLWCLALLVMGLYWCRDWAVRRSSSSLHTER